MTERPAVSDRPDAVPLVRPGRHVPPGVEIAVTTRHGGVSVPPYDTLNLALHVGDRAGDVVENRRRVAASFGARLEDLVFARQVHGAEVAVVDAADRGRGAYTEDDAVPGADALVTTDPGTTLVVMVADCVPLALVDPAAGVLAVVHAGWRGTAARVAPAALEAMAALGARPSSVWAFAGPAVDMARYQVSDEVVRALGRATPEALDPAAARADGPGHWLVDLVAANRQQLRLVGVPDTQFVTSGRTTADAAFFSDRARRPCGRSALLARLVPRTRARPGVSSGGAAP